jgi:hypothetical protein
MSENNFENIDQEYINEITDNLFTIFGSNREYLKKTECKKVLNLIFETLFEEKLKNKNFNYIFNLLSKNKDKILKDDFEAITKSFIVCFDVNYITNSNNFNDKVCIKIGKHLLPVNYYIKKNND